jgi:hypothetical protein
VSQKDIDRAVRAMARAGQQGNVVAVLPVADPVLPFRVGIGTVAALPGLLGLLSVGAIGVRRVFRAVGARLRPTPKPAEPPRDLVGTRAMLLVAAADRLLLFDDVDQSRGQLLWGDHQRVRGFSVVPHPDGVGVSDLLRLELSTGGAIELRVSHLNATEQAAMLHFLDWLRQRPVA